MRTRPSLIVSRRLVNAATNTSVDVTETPERRAERALARFQAVSKAEESVARAYLALHEEGDRANSNVAGEVFQRSLQDRNGGEGGGGGETLWSFDDEEKRVGGREGRQRETEKEKSVEGGGPEAALEHYFDDEVWAAGASRPARGKRGKDGRWTVVGAVLPDGVEKVEK